MALQFHPLPAELFPEGARWYIKRLNAELRDLFGLEGTIRQPRSVRSSDLTITRGHEFQVDVTRITPSIINVVSGVSTAVGTPSLTLGQTNVVGSTTTALSINSSIALFGLSLPLGLSSSAAVGTSAFAAHADHIHLLPDSLQSTASASTLTLTDDATNQTLAGSLGALSITTQNGYGFAATAGAGAAGQVIGVVVDTAVAGQLGGLISNFSGPFGTLTSKTCFSWDGKLVLTSGVLTTCILAPYHQSSFNIALTAGSSTDNKAYSANLSGAFISNTNGGWAEVATLNLTGARRSLSNPTVTAAHGIVMECPTISGNTQTGIYIKQRTAQQVAANRYGILIDAMNSGTVKWGAKIADKVDISAQAANVQTVLSLHQLATGAVAGAHLNLDDKAGDPPAPVTGDLWRNGDKWYARSTSRNEDLIGYVARAKWMVD